MPSADTNCDSWPVEGPSAGAYLADIDFNGGSVRVSSLVACLGNIGCDGEPAEAETAARARSLGVFDYLPKPFDPDELKLAVERAVGQQATA